jgi:hypothetical protein
MNAEPRFDAVEIVEFAESRLDAISRNALFHHQVRTLRYHHRDRF